MDIKIVETRNGGDVVLKNNDLETTDSIHNDVYIGCFGGNPGENTTGNEKEGEERGDWFGNELFFNSNEKGWINSRLEHALNTTPLSSAGLIKLNEAANEDLKFMKDYSDYSVY